MEGSFRMVNEWKEAKHLQASTSQINGKRIKKHGCRWNPPEEGTIKINVDASVFSESDTFSIWMLIRDHQDSFLADRTIRLRAPAPASVFEAEAIGVKEALSWLAEKHLSCESMKVETDSLLTEHVISRQTLNVLEVGDVIRNCCMKLQNMPRTTVTFIRKQANKTSLLDFLVFANNHVDFTSSPSCLLENLLYDSLK